MTLTAILAGFVDAAHAQALSSIADQVSNGMTAFFFGDSEGGFGAHAYAGIAGYLLGLAWMVVGVFSTLLFVRSGLKLIYGQSEDRFEEAKRGITDGIMAMVLLFLTSRLVSAFIRAGGDWSVPGVFTGSAIFTNEMLGIVRWVQVLVAVLAIAMIVAAVFSAMLSVGSDDSTERIRRAVVGAAAGILILGIDVAFRATLGLEYFNVPLMPSPFPIISRVLVVIGYVLGFMALVAVVVVIYAGIRLIFSLGNEEEFTKSKSLIFRVLLGLFVILVSYVLVRIVITALSLG